MNERQLRVVLSKEEEEARRTRTVECWVSSGISLLISLVAVKQTNSYANWHDDIRNNSNTIFFEFVCVFLVFFVDVVVMGSPRCSFSCLSVYVLTFLQLLPWIIHIEVHILTGSTLMKWFCVLLSVSLLLSFDCFPWLTSVFQFDHRDVHVFLFVIRVCVSNSVFLFKVSLCWRSWKQMSHLTTSSSWQSVIVDENCLSAEERRLNDFNDLMII